MTFDKDEFGFIAGSLKSKAARLYKVGATRLQVEEAIGDPQLNVLSELESMGYTIHRKKVRIGKNRPHFKYTIGNKNETEKKT
jgi:hypothetical protein